MHDSKIIEAMARAHHEAFYPAKIHRWPEDVDAPYRKFQVGGAVAALEALCTLRPDVAAVLRGEAVAVPREATQDMCAAHLTSLCAHGKRDAEAHWSAMLAASPYAAKEPTP